MTIDVSDLRAKYEAATKGEWSMIPTPHKRILKTGPAVVLGMAEVDAEFAVAAHTHWLAMLNEIEQLRKFRAWAAGQGLAIAMMGAKVEP